VRFPLLDGETAVLPLTRDHGQLAAGRAVVLGIRPEHIFRDHPDLRRSKPTVAPLTAPVEVVEPTGAETIAILRFGGREVVGRFDPDTAPRMDEKLDLVIDMAHACLFDPETERLI
jgi:multiple sugar transport system ATP-binding protein